MKRWLVLGGVVVAVVWGPYVYTELTRSPERGRGRHHHAFGVFASDDEETAGAGGEGADQAEPEKTDEDKDKAKDKEKDKDKDKAKADEKEKAKAEDPAKAEPAKPSDSENDTEDEPRPTWPSDQLAAFRKALDAETRDGYWAGDQETKLRALFTHAGVSDDSLGEITCRKTVCRIVFHLTDLDSEAENKLFKSVQEELGAGGAPIALDAKYDGTIAALYVLRQGYKLEH
jgi:hypothetical protein